ncbi:glycosyltransferase family 1 protein [Vibrio aquaticus]|uniref:Glycosyltransferase family 1 protein n=1 Tax=Vibrio aquaticus TaxID=2496559 RepID=A0A432CY18_9VIBR|nr:glycosyltransferase [Vibrio aquaticus]RTZ16805.1 glycosyltransferase family 1 protein [Vibrio aquaticus]
MAKKILYVHFGDNWIRGSEKCLLDQVRFVREHGYQAFVWTNSEALTHELDKMYVPHQLSGFPMLLGWQKPRFDVSAWFGLFTMARDLIEQRNIDIVHINSAAPCQWVIAAARSKQVPAVTQLHCHYPARERLTTGVHLSQHIITVSHHVAESLLQDGYPIEQLSTIHNGIDVEALSAQKTVNVKKELEIDDDAFVFATVGSLIKRKGVDRILTALRHLVLEYPNVRLVVIGDGPEKHELELQAECLHLADRVHFVGEQKNVLGWLKGCDGFVSGARSEAFGLVVAEAALAKLPIVAPFEGGIPEFIQHGKTGVIYPNHNVAPLEKAMRIVVANPTACNKMAQRAHQHILTHHSVEQAGQKILGVYRALLQRPAIEKRSLFHTFSPIKSYLSNRFMTGEQHG